MAGPVNRTGIMFTDLYGDDAQRKEFVDLDGRRVQIIGYSDNRIELDAHEGVFPRFSIHGEYTDYGDGLEFIETAPGAVGSDRGYGSPFIVVAVLVQEAPRCRTPGGGVLYINLLRPSLQWRLVHARQCVLVCHNS